LKVLLCGDSFAANFQHRDKSQYGWPNLLSGLHSVTNAAQAGVSEYKIIKQLNNYDSKDFDLTIIVHTSVSRVHIKKHPLRSRNRLHQNCDLIYADLLASDSNNPVVNTAIDYFQSIYDSEYYTDLYKMMLSTIQIQTVPHKTLHLSFFDNGIVYPFQHYINLKSIFDQYPGPINHLSDQGNMKVFDILQTWIEQSDC
jgi:hypothetical protein